MSEVLNELEKAEEIFFTPTADFAEQLRALNKIKEILYSCNIIPQMRKVSTLRQSIARAKAILAVDESLRKPAGDESANEKGEER